MSRFFGLLLHVVRWLETNVSEAVLSLSSELRFVIMDMYPLHCCLPRGVPNSENRRRGFLHQDKLWADKTAVDTFP